MMQFGYDNGGNHWGLWVLMIVAMVIFWSAVAWIVVTLVRQRAAPPSAVSPGSAPTGTPPVSEALRILNQRLALGEIDPDEYTRLRSLIEGPG